MFQVLVKYRVIKMNEIWLKFLKSLLRGRGDRNILIRFKMVRSRKFIMGYVVRGDQEKKDQFFYFGELDD